MAVNLVLALKELPGTKRAPSSLGGVLGEGILCLE